MESCKLEHVIPSGETAARIIKNMARMHDRIYQPGVAGTKEAENVGWPGDWEGRAILALALEAKALNVEPAYLDRLVDWIFDNCNEEGYRGEVIDFSAINEQSLAGHSWLLRGLIEYYSWKNDSRVLEKIKQIIENLYLPLRGKFIHYPQKAEERACDENSVGVLTGRVYSGWKTSGDTGCAFISLDGLAHAYELIGGSQLLELLEEMITVFMTIDFAGISAQTHATLTACRGIMRLYFVHKKPEYLSFCQKMFEIYKRKGMTENYANFVHFLRPSCTEPCGVIDSFMMAVFLWEATADRSYLRDAHEIWYNGVCRGQRPNGGFGCDHCVEDGTVRVHAIYESYWCCSMRGGEGTTFASTCSLQGEKDNLRFLFYFDGRYQIPWIPGLVLRIESAYPRTGEIVIRIEQSCELQKQLECNFYIPEWVENVKCMVDGKPVEYQLENSFLKAGVVAEKGTEIRLKFKIPLITMPVVGDLHKGSGFVTLRHGSLILGTKAQDVGVCISQMEYKGNGVYFEHGRIFKPLDDAYMMEKEQLIEDSYRILFRKAE
ncbi:MAG: glycoside hydrolase family 127 protein [Roseburia sp.]|nr:glycoside hydrolase family 127 protein [Roseburia sp.]